jgi:hypothetical protein
VLALAHGLSECANEPVLLSFVELAEEEVVGEVCFGEELDPSLPGGVGFLMCAGGDAIAYGLTELRLNPWCTSTSKLYLAANSVILILSGALVRAASRKARIFLMAEISQFSIVEVVGVGVGVVIVC